MVSLAQTNEVLYVVNRAGNRPSSEGAAQYLDRAIVLVRRAGCQKVLLRGDTDFYPDDSSGPVDERGCGVPLWYGRSRGAG